MSALGARGRPSARTRPLGVRQRSRSCDAAGAVSALESNNSTAPESAGLWSDRARCRRCPEAADPNVGNRRDASTEDDHVEYHPSAPSTFRERVLDGRASSGVASTCNTNDRDLREKRRTRALVMSSRCRIPRYAPGTSTTSMPVRTPEPLHEVDGEDIRPATPYVADTAGARLQPCHNQICVAADATSRARQRPRPNATRHMRGSERLAWSRPPPRGPGRSSAGIPV